MLRAIAATVVVAAVGIGGLVYASAPDPDATQEWCRVVDLATGEEVTVPCYRDPVVGTTTTTVPTAGFVETFDGDTGLNERFVFAVEHRDDVIVSQTEWRGDHDLNCGSPDTFRTVHRDTPAESFYLCRDHLMTSIGDTSGYSLGWFSPKQVFSGATSVSWDVNVSGVELMGQRQWWEVAVVPADASNRVPCMISPCGSGEGQLFNHPAGTVAIGIGPVNGTRPKFTSDEYGTVQSLGLSTVAALDPEGAASMAIRRPWSMTDNDDGTITVSFMEYSWTVPGSFPDRFVVVFKDHGYTPHKDATNCSGGCAHYTWHWDNITIN